MVRTAHRAQKKRQAKIDSDSVKRGVGTLPVEVWLSLVVFVVALFVRLVASTGLADIAIGRTPWLDSAEYLDWARHLAQGGMAWPVNPPHGPGYPLFLAGLLRFFGDSLPAIRLIQGVIGSVACVLTASISHRLFGARAGLVSGLVQAVYGPLVWVEGSILAEGPLVALLILCLWCSVGRRGTAWSLGAGLSLGAACITRATAVFLAPALLLPKLVTGTNRERLSQAAVFLFATSIIISPVVVENWSVSGTPMVQAFGGLNFYIGNSPHANGLASVRPGAEWQSLNSEAERHGASEASAQDRYYFDKTLKEIAHDPSSYVRLVLAKIVWTFQADEVRDTHSYAFFADQTALRWFPGFGLLFPFALVGAAAALRLKRALIVVWGYLLATVITCVMLVVGTRYRLPMVPALIIFAGLGVEVVVGLFANPVPISRVGLQRLAVALIFILGIAIPHVWSDARTRNFSEEWVYTGKSLELEGRPQDAETAYRRAIALDDRSEYAWDRLGALLLRTGRRHEGREALLTALKLAPRYSDAEYHLGIAEEEDKNFQAAVLHFRRASELAPATPSYAQALARTLVSAGNYDEAEQLYLTLVRRWPQDSSSHAGLAFLLDSRGEIASAAAQARTAVNLDPGNQTAWLLVARTAIDQRDERSAEEALSRLRVILGPNQPEVLYLEQETRRLRR